jgi:hypothetical protein
VVPAVAFPPPELPLLLQAVDATAAKTTHEEIRFLFNGNSHLLDNGYWAGTGRRAF